MDIFAHKKREKKKAYRPSICHISNPYKGIGDSNGIYFKLFLRSKIDYESIMRLWIQNLFIVSWDHLMEFFFVII